METEANPTTPDANPETWSEQPVFEALLYPRRSLDRRGYGLLIGGTGLIIGLYGVTFLLVGAWPIFGFLGAEWLLFWYLFSRHYRGDRRAERLRLFPDRLLVEARDPRGKLTTYMLQPYWLQVILDRADTFHNPLYLRSHGRQLEIGAFLSPQERREFAAELIEVLRRQRSSASAQSAN